VFAATQVTGYMVHEHRGRGVVQGLLLLALLWWTWSAYAWLGNQARADAGVVRAGMAVAMAAMSAVALTVPEAWQDAPGGLDGPLVLVGAYLVVRCTHLTLDRTARRLHHPGHRRVGGRHRRGRRHPAHQRAAAGGGRPGRGRRRRAVVAVLRRGLAVGRAPTA